MKWKYELVLIFISFITLIRTVACFFIVILHVAELLFVLCYNPLCCSVLHIIKLAILIKQTRSNMMDGMVGVSCVCARMCVRLTDICRSPVVVSFLSPIALHYSPSPTCNSTHTSKLTKLMQHRTYTEIWSLFSFNCCSNNFTVSSSL